MNSQIDPFILIVFLQIVLESLPISSSGHIWLIQKIFNVGQVTKFWDYFLHGPTLIILMMVFFRQWFSLAKRLISGMFCKKISNKDSYKKLSYLFFKIVGLVFSSSFITVLIWFFVKLKLEKYIWFSSNFVIIGGFFITIICLFSLFFIKDFHGEKFDFKKSVVLGFVQGLALIPGISRFAIVYSTCRILKIAPRRAFEITFLVQLPIIVGGFGLGLYDLVKADLLYKVFDWKILLTVILASLISFYVLSFMKKLAVRQKIWLFGFYVLFLIFFILISVIQ